jgi:hypothetical protein
MGQPISSPYKSKIDMYAKLSNNHKQYCDSVFDDIVDKNNTLCIEDRISSNRINRTPVSYTDGSGYYLNTDSEFKQTLDNTGNTNNNAFDLNTRCDLLLLFNQQIGFDIYNKHKGDHLNMYKEIKYEKVMNEDNTECTIFRQSTKYRPLGSFMMGNIKNWLYN